MHIGLLMRPTYVDGNDVIAALFSSGGSGIANQQCEVLLKRKLRYSFSAQSRRDFPASQAWPDQRMVAIAASLACPMRFKFWTQICLPTQFTLDRATGGAFGYLYWGISHGNRTSAT